MRIYQKLKIEKDRNWQGDIEGFLSLIRCPLCGYEYNHILKVKEVSSNDNYEAWEGRGNVTKIFIEGECGHYWNLCIGFHKGNLFLYCESLEIKK